MRKYILALAGIGAATMMALATPAMAAGTWTVTNGGTLSFGGQGASTLRDITTGNVLSCSPGSVVLKVPNGTGLSGTGIGVVTGYAFGNCTGPLGITFTVSAFRPWLLNALSYNSSTGVTSGTVSNIGWTLSGSLCSATLTGTASATYTNSPSSNQGVLAVSRDGNLLTVTAASCLGILNVGDVLVWTGSYKDGTSPFLRITSP